MDIICLNFLGSRTPFDVNTTFRCAIVVLYEAIIILCVICSLSVLTCILIDVLIVSQACLSNITALLDNVDDLLKSKNVENEMFEYCIAATDLHVRVIEYGPNHFQTDDFVISSLSISRFMQELKDLVSLVVVMMLVPWTITIVFALFIIAMVSVTPSDIDCEFSSDFILLTVFWIELSIGFANAPHVQHRSTCIVLFVFQNRSDVSHANDGFGRNGLPD